MLISERIEDDFKKALKSGDKNKVSILRMIKSTMKNKEIEKRGALTDDDIQAILRSFSKRGKESIEQFSKAGRTDLVDKEREELMIVQQYLPKQLVEEEIKRIIKDVINEVGATGIKDMGKVMKAVMAKTKGQAEGKLVNNFVKEMLEE